MPEIEKEKKYELLSTDWIELIDCNHKKHILHRIRAIIDFGDVKTGDYGGYIESENNLNQYDNSWVYSDAVRISKNAKIWGQSRVYGNVKIYNSVEVCDYAIVCDDVKLYGDCKVHGRSKVYGNCYIGGISDISGNSNINGTLIHITGDTTICDNVKIEGKINIDGVSTILGNTTIIGDNIFIKGDILIREATNIRDSAYISSNNDFISITNLGINRNIMTSYLTKDLIIMINFEDFIGTYDEFLDHIHNNYEEEINLEIESFMETIKQRFIVNREIKGGN